jgi:hypothetical protein
MKMVMGRGSGSANERAEMHRRKMLAKHETMKDEFYRKGYLETHRKQGFWHLVIISIVTLVVLAIYGISYLNQ